MWAPETQRGTHLPGEVRVTRWAEAQSMQRPRKLATEEDAECQGKQQQGAGGRPRVGVRTRRVLPPVGPPDLDLAGAAGIQMSVKWGWGRAESLRQLCSFHKYLVSVFGARCHSGCTSTWDRCLHEVESSAVRDVTGTHGAAWMTLVPGRSGRRGVGETPRSQAEAGRTVMMKGLLTTG